MVEVVVYNYVTALLFEQHDCFLYIFTSFHTFLYFHCD